MYGLIPLIVVVLCEAHCAVPMVLRFKTFISMSYCFLLCFYSADGTMLAPLASGHLPWSLPSSTAAADRKHTLSSTSPAALKAELMKAKASKEAKSSTFMDVEELAICVSELAALYRRRLDAHMQHAVRLPCHA